MKKIDYVIKVWSDLESSYEEFLKVEPDISRLDYLKRLVCYKPQNSGAVIIPLFLSDELGSYNDKELADYDNLIELMNRVHDSLGRTSEIHNLQEFVYGAVVTNNDSTIPDIRDYEFYANNNYCSAVELLRTGNFSNCVIQNATTSRAYVLDPDDTDMFVLNNIYDMTSFLQSPGNLTDFRLTAYAAVVKMYMAKQQMTFPLVFLSNSLFDVSEKDVTVNCTGQKILYSTKNCIKEDFTINLPDGPKTIHLDFIWRNLKTDFGVQKLVFVR